ncbi:MAG: hypothetical protein ACKO96_05070 [Flammeovirgaceae bacterium]
MNLAIGNELNVKEIWLDDERVENFSMKVDYIENGWFEIKGTHNGLFHYFKFPIDMPMHMLEKIGITKKEGITNDKLPIH